MSTLGTRGPRSLCPQPRCSWTGTQTLPDCPPGQRGPAQPATLLQGQLRPGTPQTGPRPPGPPRSPLPRTPQGVPVHLLRAPSWALLPLLRKAKLGGQMAGQLGLEPGSRTGPHSAPPTGAHPAPRPTPNPHPRLQGPPSCEPHVLSPGTTAGFPPASPRPWTCNPFHSWLPRSEASVQVFINKTTSFNDDRWDPGAGFKGCSQTPQTQPQPAPGSDQDGGNGDQSHSPAQNNQKY